MVKLMQLRTKVFHILSEKYCQHFFFGASMWEKVGNGMDQFFFSGSSDGKLDEKNRFVLPQAMRYGLVEEGKLEFSVGLGLGGCLAIYRRSDIQKIVERFRKRLHQAKYQKFFTLFFSTLFHTSCDKIGRVTLPNRLKQLVKIDKEIVIAGVLDKIEIWPKDGYDSSLDSLMDSKDGDLAELMEGAFALLNEESETNEQPQP